ncbi:murein L,D-transpeptidase catalytic domain family protein [Coxiella burnetii]|uniref:murein L,D-transpeptidase catalytic domain family protein n=1 Tax=Coxiella burnetii TaxID=777 RepID=UPI000BFEA968|nr:murein L,D-transpeptidase catalytic domain family protein [Coxiella burnetii]PHH58114.1 hypothetical protein CRH12_01235 [Coxiella burnetii]
MKRILLILVVILVITALIYFLAIKEKPLPSSKPVKEAITQVEQTNEKKVTFGFQPSINQSFNEVSSKLHQEAQTLDIGILNKSLKIVKCANEYGVEHNNILTIIDYSLPSNKKRLWVFDLAKDKLLFHTYVSHGIKSGILSSQYFSNKVNSKASSIGVYDTEKAYHGRHGLSLKLYGLDKNFNDNAYRRFIVMHGSWYVNETFIKKYGRAGRSWGCPSLPADLTQPIINTIANNSLLIVYYPNPNWFSKSQFLNCDHSKIQVQENAQPEIPINEERDPILFADLNNDDKREENEPIIVITADNYQQLFNTAAPLNRMLRRQINNIEYVALNESEFKKVYPHNLNEAYFVIPIVKLQRGYYATEMKIINLGKIKKIEPNTNPQNKEEMGDFKIYLEWKSPILLKSTKRFIRWLGL